MKFNKGDKVRVIKKSENFSCYSPEIWETGYVIDSKISRSNTFVYLLVWDNRNVYSLADNLEL